MKVSYKTMTFDAIAHKTATDKYFKIHDDAKLATKLAMQDAKQKALTLVTDARHNARKLERETIAAALKVFTMEQKLANPKQKKNYFMSEYLAEQKLKQLSIRK